MMTVLVISVGALLLARGSLEAADLVAFLLLINNFTDPVKQLIRFTEMFQNGMSGYSRFREILAVEPDIEDAPDAVEIDHVDGEIRFENVDFRYASSKEDVLHHLNMTVKPGEYVALVGSSGVGKSTLCSLIPRFYEVNGGRITLDGRDIRKITLKSLREQIGIVRRMCICSQEPCMRISATEKRMRPERLSSRQQGWRELMSLLWSFRTDMIQTSASGA